jgi:hypothetical protein
VLVGVAAIGKNANGDKVAVAAGTKTASAAATGPSMAMVGETSFVRAWRSTCASGAALAAALAVVRTRAGVASLGICSNDALAS